jgi:6-phosphogluconolactonase
MKPRVPDRFELLADAGAVARAAARSLLTCARESIALRGRFRVVLAGGTTPLAAYRMLSGESAGWASWEVYFGDERCLPRGHPGRNDLAARQAFLDSVPVPREHVFAVPAELGPEKAALAYTGIIAEAMPFDLVLLGMGEDGHTASLFPDRRIDDEALVIPVHDAPKPPSERVSLSPKALAACREMLVLVTGSAKRDALAAWRRGADLPISRVTASTGARVLLDPAAAGAGYRAAERH